MEEAKSFLGIGWNFPVAFSKEGREVLMAHDATDIAQSLKILITTARPERLMHPAFGSNLKQFLYEEITLGMVSIIENDITNTISLYETRISLLNVDINQDATENGKLLINIDYVINGTNTRTNMVYPFYIQEATNKAMDYE